MSDTASSKSHFSVLDRIPLGVCVLDRDLVVRFWNTCLADWTGLSKSEIQGHDLSERFPFLREPRYLWRLKTVFEGGPPTIFSSQLHRHFFPAPLPGGGLRVLHTVVAAIEMSTEPEFGALFTFQDVTDLDRGLEDLKRAEEERRRMEARFQHAQKLESLGVLAGGIAHDFNNLLVGILGNADMALRRLGDSKRGRRQLKAVVKSARRAAELANQMLAYSGHGSFMTSALDLSAVIREAVELLGVGISKKARLDLLLGDGLPTVEVDPTQIRQVVMNLVTNASEALEEKSGSITITTEAVECDPEDWVVSPGSPQGDLAGSYLEEDLPAGLYVHLAVTDTGHGMDRTTLEKIFDPFFSTKFTGRGLGLAAVLGIVRGHHGALKINSEPGRGTTFHVYFPAAERPAEPAPIPRDEKTVADGPLQGTVLVVDDEEAVRGLARMIFEEEGLEVLTARDGEEAVRIYRERPDSIALVLLDMSMPELSGDETLEELRKIRSDVKVILTSGYTEQRARIRDPEVVGFIQKPYLPDDLVAKVRRVLSTTSY